MAYSLRVTVTRPVYEHMAPQALQYGLIPELLASLDWQAGRAGGGAAAGGAGAAGGAAGGGGDDDDAAVLRVLAVDVLKALQLEGLHSQQVGDSAGRVGGGWEEGGGGWRRVGGRPLPYISDPAFCLGFAIGRLLLALSEPHKLLPGLHRRWRLLALAAPVCASASTPAPAPAAPL
jgi:hypothetical protein